jgi:glycosyltransferase involved in cell wall biosynthesis
MISPSCSSVLATAKTTCAIWSGRGVRTRGLEDQITFTGRIPDEEVERYISSSDVCASPDPKNDLNDQSTMNKVLEYMALAKPIVAFDLKETRYSAGDAALYATPNDFTDFGDKVLELLDDEPRRREMGLFGQRRLREQLAWSHSQAALVRSYARLAGLRPRFQAARPAEPAPLAGDAPAGGVA